MENKVKKEIYDALVKIKARDFEGAESLLQSLLKKAQEIPSQEGRAEQALILSTLGVLEKVREDYKAAWRYYEKAEKILPDDPSLKLIMAQLMINEFSQYDVAIKKMNSVIELAKGSPSFEHQAYATMAMAYLRKGDRKKALEMFEKSMKGDFAEMTSSQNINLDVIETFLARNFESERCRTYLEKALALAKSKKESSQVALFNKLLLAFAKPVEVHSVH